MRLFLLICALVLQGFDAYRVICVYTNWAQYRPDGGKFMPEDVDATLCTHLIYVYAKLKGNKLAPAEWNDEGTAWREGMYERVNNLKQVNPELKTLLGVGGWMMGSKDFSNLASGKASRRMFASSTVKFLRDRNFDGLAVDWQHPTKRGGKAKDKTNYSLLLQELRATFDEDSKKTGQSALLLAAGVSASREIIDDAYEIDNLTKYLDFVNIMAYDLHGSWDNYTGHPSQLYARESEFGPSAELNVDGSMRYWMSQVLDKSKLILGVSTYGRTFTLRKARHNDYNVPTTGPGLAGEFTQQPGMLAYYERCSQYADATRVWDETSQVAYWYQGDQWAAGEDTESIKAKVNWARTHELGGVMVWSLDTDDFGSKCRGETYPLLRTVLNALKDPNFVKVIASVSKEPIAIAVKIPAPSTAITQSTESSTEGTMSTDPIPTSAVRDEPTTGVKESEKTTKSWSTERKSTRSKQVTQMPTKMRKQTTPPVTKFVAVDKAEQNPNLLKEGRGQTPQKRKLKRRRLTPEQRRRLMQFRKLKRQRIQNTKQNTGSTVSIGKEIPLSTGSHVTASKQVENESGDDKSVQTFHNEKQPSSKSNVTAEKGTSTSNSSKGSIPSNSKKTINTHDVNNSELVNVGKRVKVAKRKKPNGNMVANRKQLRHENSASHVSGKSPPTGIDTGRVVTTTETVTRGALPIATVASTSEQETSADNFKMKRQQKVRGSKMKLQRRMKGKQSETPGAETREHI